MFDAQFISVDISLAIFTLNLIQHFRNPFSGLRVFLYSLFMIIWNLYLYEMCLCAHAHNPPMNNLDCCGAAASSATATVDGDDKKNHKTLNELVSIAFCNCFFFLFAVRLFK